MPKPIDFVVLAYKTGFTGLSLQENWANIFNPQALPIGSIEALKPLQRRLSPLAKAVFSVAYACFGENKSIPLIFCTTHGEIHKSLAMLIDMQAGEEISPTAFSLSVHNAISGLFSIAFVNHQEVNVIASGQDGIVVGFLDALGLLYEGKHQEVLLVYYDEPLPDFFIRDPGHVHLSARGSLALRISLSGQGIPVSLLRSTGLFIDSDLVSQMRQFWQFISSDAQSLTMGNHRNAWRWCKR